MIDFDPNIEDVLMPQDLAMKNIRQAKINGDRCPFSEESLNELFGKAEK